MYSFITVPQLKVELRKRNANTAGKKADLIEILESYDRNQQSGVENNNQEDPCLPAYLCSPAEMFKDINSDSPLPVLNRHAIQEYFSYISFPKNPIRKKQWLSSLQLKNKFWETAKICSNRKVPADYLTENRLKSTAIPFFSKFLEQSELKSDASAAVSASNMELIAFKMASTCFWRHSLQSSHHSGSASNAHCILTAACRQQRDNFRACKRNRFGKHGRG